MRSFVKGRALRAALLVCLAGCGLAHQAEAQTTRPAPVRSIRREVLPDLVRITVSLDREVPINYQRSESPARLVLDLKGARPVAKLAGSVLRYDTDAVREIRFAPQQAKGARILVDLDGVKHYSVYTLYKPYRIVIDCESSDKGDASKGGKAPRVLPTSVASLPIAPIASSVPAIATREKTPAPAPAMAVRAPVAPAVNTGGTFSVARQLGLGVSRVVIDAGHGGHDPGARAFGVSESELVLDIALRLEKLLQQRAGVDTVLTRRTDEFVSLEDRTEIANRESADLFLSIHANASSNDAAQGVETYFLNFALNRQAEAVAARENAGSGRTMSSLPGILKAISLNSKLNESRDFAGSIQQSMVKTLRPANKDLRDLGVKQAPFMVLIGAAMPSVLAEVSFVTNRADAKLLKTAAYRQKIAESLLAGVLSYQRELKKVQTASLQ